MVEETQCFVKKYKTQRRENIQEAARAFSTFSFLFSPLPNTHTTRLQGDSLFLFSLVIFTSSRDLKKLFKRCMPFLQHLLLPLLCSPLHSKKEGRWGGGKERRNCPQTLILHAMASEGCPFRFKRIDMHRSWTSSVHTLEGSFVESADIGLGIESPQP